MKIQPTGAKIKEFVMPSDRASGERWAGIIVGVCREDNPWDVDEAYGPGTYERLFPAEEPFYNAETGQVEDEAGYKKWLDDSAERKGEQMEREHSYELGATCWCGETNATSSDLVIPHSGAVPRARPAEQEIRMILQPDGTYIVSVTKSFEPEYGGGQEVFSGRSGKGPHAALDAAQSMVTVSPSRNSLVLQES